MKEHILERIKYFFAVTLGWAVWFSILIWIGAIVLTAEQHNISLFGPLLLTTLILGGILGGILFLGLTFYASPKTKRKYPVAIVSVWAILVMLVGLTSIMEENGRSADAFPYGAATLITCLIFYLLNRFRN